MNETERLKIKFRFVENLLNKDILMINIICLNKNYSITRLLTRSIPVNEVWAGNPAKFI